MKCIFKIHVAILLFTAISTGIVNAQSKVWSLKDCIEYAFENDVALNQQRLTAEISKINYEQAKSNRLPNLDFTDIHQFSFGNTINSGSNQVSHQNTVNNAPTVTGTLVAFNRFKYIDLVKENRLSYEASTLDIETQKNNLALNITAAYMQVLFAYDAKAIAQRQVGADSAQVIKTAKYVAVGQLAESNLLQIQAQLSADKASVVSAQNQLELANVQLEQLMELPIMSGFTVERPGESNITLKLGSDPAGIYHIAESTLPDVASAELKIKASEMDLEVNKAAFTPVLNISGGLTSEYYSALSPRASYQTTYQNETIGYLQSNPSELVTGPVPVTTTSSQAYPFFSQLKDNFSPFVTINLAVPIFNNYKARNNIRLSKIAIENARLNEQAIKNQLRKNVEQAYTDQQAAGKNYTATVDQLNSETRSFTDIQKKFNVGLASATDMLVEQNNYYKSVLANLQAKYEYLFKTKVVDFYSGIPLTQ